MINKKVVLLLCMSLWLSLGLTAQEFPLRHFTTDEGLPSNIAYSIICDHDGYLWIGTDKGITRYDGTTFKTFTTYDGLPDNEIFGFVEDSEHRLWVASFGGQLCFYKEGIFHTAHNTPWLKVPFKTSTSTFMDNEYDGSITILFEQQQQAVNVKHNTVQLISIDEIPKNQILAVKKLSAFRYKICLRLGSIEIDTTGKASNWKPYLTPGNFSVAVSPDTVLLWGKKGVYSLEGRLMYPLVSDYDTTNICFYNKGPYTFSGNGHQIGLQIGDSTKILKNTYSTKTVQDHNGDYWVSTRGAGIYGLSQYLFDIKEYKHIHPRKVLYARIIGDSVTFADETGNFFRITPALLRQHTVSSFPPAPRFAFELTRSNFLVLDQGECLKAYQEGILSKWYFIGRSGQKLAATLPYFGYTKEAFQVRDYIYIVTISNVMGISLDNLSKGNVRALDTLLMRDNDFRSRIYGRASDKAHNQLWISTTENMFSIAGNKKIMHRDAYKGITFRQFGFIGDYMVGFTDKNKLLICNHYNDHPVIGEAAQQKVIWDYIYPIDDSRAIITSNGYYYRLILYPSAGQPKYTLQAIENPFIPQQAECIAAGPDKCYFFKDGSITVVATKVLFAGTPPPVPVFSEIRTKTKKYRISSPVHITYHESSGINILFDNISFVAKDITCEYSISKDGEDNWHEISGNEINLNTPGFGTYQVKVRAKTLSSGFSPLAVLTLIIEKPFWATWWFITIASLVFILLIWLIIQFFSWRKIRKKQKEHDADMKFQQSEYKALNALMNPHFIFNSLNNIQGLINKDEKRTANQYLVIFSDMIRQNMHNISKGFISLQQELDLIENYLNLEKLRFKELVNYKIEIEDEVETDDIMIPPLMIQPLVENAIKHGLLPKQSVEGMVRIYVYERNNLLYIEIEDNGVGITYAQKHHSRLQESFSLSNMQQRTEHLKKIQKREISIDIKEVKDEYGHVKGTMALVTMELE